MKAADLRKETDEQLKLSLGETEKHLFKLRFQSATDKLSTPSEIRKARRDIARIRSEQRRRELVAESKLSDTDLTAKAALAAEGLTAPNKPFLGRRQAKRVTHRLNKIATQRLAAAKASPASAQKGK